MIRLLLIWVMASIVMGMLWAGVCGPADLDDADDLWPDDRGGA